MCGSLSQLEGFPPPAGAKCPLCGADLSSAKPDVGLGPPPLPMRATEADSYDKIADTVGMVPSKNMKDTVFQAIFIGVGLAVGIGVGALIGGLTGGSAGCFYGLFLGALGGLILSTLISGVILMVRGWKRARSKDHPSV